ncbi:hypothetical protein CHLRE_11g467533v5 [Chlamydomonas reinhardtii]|uniref:Transposase n=1 Tax=Chlamydomonas reinhardtii TaxID=3055 RepID=A0A2K3D772_CHLRE|nr:uncharacterized protein CHLRE_11g467533v5 [Chlamydomonas reinhardtii]PNW76377.1 hypothetical protein CHLRE_11g467533v5 [Chlamydomonas reinhardtii]
MAAAAAAAAATAATASAGAETEVAAQGWRGTRQHTHQRAATERRRQQRACFTRLSGAGYRHYTGQTGRRLWLQARLKEQPALKRCQAGIPSARVASAADHELRIRYLYSGGGVDAAAAAGSAPAPVQQYGLWHLLRFYRQWGQRRWRLTVHVRTQKVLEHKTQQLAGGRPKEEVIVGWGNANTGYGGCISRSGRGPNRALLRLLVDKYAHLVVYVDEFYTSQVCAKCGRRLLGDGQRCLQAVVPWGAYVLTKSKCATTAGRCGDVTSTPQPTSGTRWWRCCWGTSDLHRCRLAAAAAVAAAAAAAAAAGVRAHILVAEGAGKATWRRRAQRRPRSGASAQAEEPAGVQVAVRGGAGRACVAACVAA